MPIANTKIAISEEMRNELHYRKAPGDSYDDVIRRLAGVRDGANDE